MYLNLSSRDEDKISAVFSFDGTPDFENELPTQDIAKYLSAVFRPASAPIGLLPPAVRWLSADRKICIFERPPVMQNVEIIARKRDNISHGNQKYMYKIPIPWTVYMCFFNADYEPVKLKVYVRNEPLSSMDDFLYLIPMHNFYYDSSLCNPIWNDFYDGQSTLAMGIDRAYNMVWNSGFNYDLVDAISLSMTQVFQDYWNNPDKFRKDQPEAVGDNFLDYYLYWSKIPVRDILSQQWAWPGSGQKHSNPAVNLGVKAALNFFTKEILSEFGDPGSDFVLRMMNAMYG